MDDKYFDVVTAVMQELKDCQELNDPDLAHKSADYALCNMLVTLGYREIVAEWSKVKRRYS